MALLEWFCREVLRLSRERPKKLLMIYLIVFCYLPPILILAGFVCELLAGFGALLGVANVALLILSASRFTLIPLCMLPVAYLLYKYLPGPDFLFYWVMTTDLVTVIALLRLIDRLETMEELLTRDFIAWVTENINDLVRKDLAIIDSDRVVISEATVKEYLRKVARICRLDLLEKLLGKS